MYKIDLFQYKSQFHYVFNVNPGNQGSPFFFFPGSNITRFNVSYPFVTCLLTLLVYT
jgi:hypothetical protein